MRLPIFGPRYYGQKLIFGGRFEVRVMSPLWSPASATISLGWIRRYMPAAAGNVTIRSGGGALPEDSTGTSWPGLPGAPPSSRQQQTQE